MYVHNVCTNPWGPLLTVFVERCGWLCVYVWPMFWVGFIDYSVYIWFGYFCTLSLSLSLSFFYFSPSLSLSFFLSLSSTSSFSPSLSLSLFLSLPPYFSFLTPLSLHLQPSSRLKQLPPTEQIYDQLSPLTPSPSPNATDIEVSGNATYVLERLKGCLILT